MISRAARPAATLVGVAALLSLSAGLPGAVLPGQEPAAAEITGRVVDSLAGSPLTGAWIYGETSRAETRAGQDGRFALPVGTPREGRIVVRSVGYVPRLVDVPVTDSGADLGTIPLRAVATRLDQIAVEAEEVRIEPGLAGFYRRKQNGLGTFLTRDDIERRHPRKTSQLLEHTSGVVIECPRSGSTSDCIAYNSRGKDIRLRSGAVGGGRALPGGIGAAGGGGTPGEEDAAAGWQFTRCPMAIWLDGTPSTLGLDEIPAETIVAIEVYPGAALTPATFGTGRCGVIAIWTRSRG